ncbi:MAG: HupE/UreJ family protein [Pseudomonadota bacterium]
MIAWLGVAGRLALAAGLLLILILTPATQTAAHLLNMSKARILLQPGGDIELHLALDLLLTAGSRDAYFELSRISDPMSSPEVRETLGGLADAVSLTLGGVRVPLALADVRFPREPRKVFLDPLAWPRTELTLRGSLASLPRTPTDRGLRVRYDDSFRFEEPIANTFEDTAAGTTQTRWLVSNQTSPIFDAGRWLDIPGPPPLSPALDWFALVDFAKAGLRHILPAGIDHLLFVAGLCLGAGSLRSLVAVISVFTLAHSLTLCAMVLGWVSVPARIVESLILLSIVWIAVANVVARNRGKMRSMIVLIFGLLHGLGFAGALLDLGLPAKALVPSLLAFNVGVECGQLLFVLMLLFGLQLLRRWRGIRMHQALLPAEPALLRGGSMLIALGAGLLIATNLALFDPRLA